MLVQVGPPASSKTATPNHVLPVIPGDRNELVECHSEATRGRSPCRPIGQQRSCCDDQLNPPNTPRSRSATAVVRQVCDPRWVRSAMPMTTPCARASSRPSNANCSSAAGSRRRARREAQCSPSSRASTIRDAVTHRSDTSHRLTTNTGIMQQPSIATHTQPAAVLVAAKDKLFGRPQEAAVLDRHCARQPRQCAGRDGRMAPPGAEPKNAQEPEDNMT